jgi:hypothetical protein
MGRAAAPPPTAMSWLTPFFYFFIFFTRSSFRRRSSLVELNAMGCSGWKERAEVVSALVNRPKFKPFPPLPLVFFFLSFFLSFFVFFDAHL